jgi:hypothetical protein
VLFGAVATQQGMHIRVTYEIMRSCSQINTNIREMSICKYEVIWNNIRLHDRKVQEVVDGSSNLAMSGGSVGSGNRTTRTSQLILQQFNGF